MQSNTPFSTVCGSYNWRAENQSGLTQNHVLEIAWVAQICNKNMHTLPMYALNFEILKFSAAPETYIKSILICLGGQIQQ